jgi:hypothetical protein
VRLVIIESPYAGDPDGNLAYARAALADSLARGEAPFASHLLYPQVLDDMIPISPRSTPIAAFRAECASEFSTRNARAGRLNTGA